jgi:hypothetical protein
LRIDFALKLLELHGVSALFEKNWFRLFWEDFVELHRFLSFFLFLLDRSC